jgi:hypothetical protein
VARVVLTGCRAFIGKVSDIVKLLRTNNVSKHYISSPFERVPKRKFNIPQNIG